MRDEIAAKAMELRDPDGEPIVAAVHRREELFEGPQLEKVPDLLIEFAEYAWLGKGNLKKRARRRSGTGSRSSPAASTSTSAATGTRGCSRSPGPSAAQAPRTLAEHPGRRPDRPLPARRAAADASSRAASLAEAIEPALLDARPPEYDDAATSSSAPCREQLQRGRGGRGRGAPARPRLPGVGGNLRFPPGPPPFPLGRRALLWPLAEQAPLRRRIVAPRREVSLVRARYEGRRRTWATPRIRSSSVFVAAPSEPAPTAT